MPRPGHFTPRKGTCYPLYRCLGGLQGGSGGVRKFSTLTRIRSTDGLARSKSLYRLQCLDPQMVTDVLERLSPSSWQWLLWTLHANGASLFFVRIYLHTGRNLYYRSYNFIHTWSVGVVILIVIIATEFIGYVLPWGRVSFIGYVLPWGQVSFIGYFLPWGQYHL